MLLTFSAAPPWPNPFRTLAPKPRENTRRHLVACTTSPAKARETLLALTTPSEARVGRDEQLAPLLAELTRPPYPSVDRRLLGVWRNAHTSVPETASPIQRAFIRNDTFVPQVQQIVVGDDIPEAIVNRISLPFGFLNLLGRVTSAEDKRLRLRFVSAWFWLNAGIRLPYPVPFRLLGKKACGWLDVVYVDDDIRVAKGNRGSTFVLRKEHNNGPFPNDLVQELNSVMQKTWTMPS